MNFIKKKIRAEGKYKEIVTHCQATNKLTRNNKQELNLEVDDKIRRWRKLCVALALPYPNKSLLNT